MRKLIKVIVIKESNRGKNTFHSPLVSVPLQFFEGEVNLIKMLIKSGKDSTLDPVLQMTSQNCLF